MDTTTGAQSGIGGSGSIRQCAWGVCACASQHLPRPTAKPCTRKTPFLLLLSWPQVRARSCLFLSIPRPVKAHSTKELGLQPFLPNQLVLSKFLDRFSPTYNRFSLPKMSGKYGSLIDNDFADEFTVPKIHRQCSEA